ncbi:unnamed protein product [Brassica oleracea]
MIVIRWWRRLNRRGRRFVFIRRWRRFNRRRWRFIFIGWWRRTIIVRFGSYCRANE